MKKISLVGIGILLTLTGCTGKIENTPITMKTDDVLKKMEENVRDGKVFYYSFSKKWKENQNVFHQKGDFAVDKKDNMVKFQQYYQGDTIFRELSNYSIDGKMYRFVREEDSQQLLKIKNTEQKKIVELMKSDIYHIIDDTKECLVSKEEIKSNNHIFSLNNDECDHMIFNEVSGKLKVEVNAETFDFKIHVENSEGQSLDLSYDKDTDYIVKLPVDKNKAKNESDENS